MTFDFLWDQLNGKDITALKNNCHKQKFFSSPCFHFQWTGNESAPSYFQALNPHPLSAATGHCLVILQRWPLRVKNFPHIPPHPLHLSLMLRFIAKISLPNNIVLILSNLKGCRCHWQRTHEMFTTLGTPCPQDTKDTNAVGEKAS